MAIEYSYEEGQIKLRSTDEPKRRCWYILIVVLLLSFGLGIWLFIRGYFVPVDSDSPQAISLRGKLNEQAHTLERQSTSITELENELGIVRREKAIQKTANEELNKQLLLAEQKLSEAEEQLLLYGNILSTKDLEAGLRIQHFGIKMIKVDNEGQKLDSDRYYRYSLVLSNIRNDETTTVTGNFEITLTGQEKGKKASVSLSHLDLPLKENQAVSRFSLKYYKSLDGELLLPEGFSPKKVSVVVKPKDGKALEESYKWNTLLTKE
jgi:hypothetical protein